MSEDAEYLYNEMRSRLTQHLDLIEKIANTLEAVNDTLAAAHQRFKNLEARVADLEHGRFWRGV